MIRNLLETFRSSFELHRNLMLGPELEEAFVWKICCDVVIQAAEGHCFAHAQWLLEGDRENAIRATAQTLEEAKDLVSTGSEVSSPVLQMCLTTWFDLREFWDNLTNDLLPLATGPLPWRDAPKDHVLQSRAWNEAMSPDPRRWNYNKLDHRILGVGMHGHTRYN